MHLPVSTAEQSPLTARQVEIVQLVVGGKTAGQIGDLLGLSRRTVEGHLREARQRVGVSTVAQLAGWVVAAGIASPVAVPSSPGAAAADGSASSAGRAGC